MLKIHKLQLIAHRRFTIFLVYSCFLIISTVSFSCTNSTRPISSNLLVVPGQAIGTIRLEHDAAETMKLLGKPDVGDAAMGKAVSTWYVQHDTSKPSLSIFTAVDLGNSPDALIKQIRTSDPTYKTTAGIGVSSQLADIQKVFKLASEKGYTLKGQQVAVYSDSSGIAFEFNNKGTCIGIVVYSTGSLHPDTYARFIPGMSSKSSYH